MKNKIIFIVMISLLIFFIALSFFFGYFYLQRGKTIKILNEGLNGIRNSVIEDIDVEKSQEVLYSDNIEAMESQDIEYQTAVYNKDKIVNSNNQYGEGYTISPPRGTLYVENNIVTYSYIDFTSNYCESATYVLDEKVIDTCRTTGGIGTYEQIAFVTESGRVFINYTTDGENTIELTNLPKICRVVSVALLDDPNRKSTLIGIDESGNCYDLGIARNEL